MHHLSEKKMDNLIFSLVWSLATSCLLVQAQGCDYIPMNAGAQITVSSPGYGAYFGPLKSYCQTISAPQGFSISASCYVDVPDSNGCPNNKFFFSNTYNPSMVGAEYFCGPAGNLVRSSLYNTIQLAYQSSSSTAKGRYTCILTNSCSCGWYSNPKIVGGWQAQPYAYPSFVSIVNRRYPSNPPLGGGVIISTRWVLTVAHCLDTGYSSVSDLLLLMGTVDLTYVNSTGTAQLMGVSGIYKHPNYNQQTVANDIALIYTSSDITYNGGVGPACLPTYANRFAYDNQYVDLVGFGSTGFSKPVSQQLLATTVKTITNSVCRSDWPNLIDGQFCTFMAGKDACQYDSGGPVYYKSGSSQTVIGLISQGIGCAGSQPAVQTRVGYYIPWIQATTNAYFCGI